MNTVPFRPWHFLAAALLFAAPVCHAQTPAAATSGTPSCSGPGTERWPVKTSLPSGADLTQSKTVGLNDMLAVAQPPGVEHNDKRFQDARIPSFSNSLNVKEGDLITTTGFLYLVATESDDCDYHIQLSNQPRTTTDKPTASDDCLIVEAPRPDFVPDAALKDKVTAARDFIKTKVMHGAEPSNTASVMVHSVCVRVTGQLFYDDAHVGGGKVELRGKKGMHSNTLWELHPIFSFQIVTPDQCKF
jgi:hypothetical protein